MKIGGLLKTSMIDFPGLVSCVIFTSGCNFFCPYCHNPDLASGRPPMDDGSFIDEKDIISFLKKRKKLIDGVVISGGEPTLHDDLSDFCFKIKEMGYKIKLDTNGSNPEILKKLFEKKLIDFTAMDIKTSPENYHILAGKKFNFLRIPESIGVICKDAPSYEFRTTCVKPFIDKIIINDIGKMIQGASSYILQQCSKNVKMLNPDFFKKKNMFFSDEELLELKKEVENYVVNCSVR